MEEQLKSNLTSSKLWVRMVYMLLIAFFCHIASFIIGVLVVVQCLITLVNGANNSKLRVFGRSLVLYIQQGLFFLTFNSECKPYPFSDWPEVKEESEPSVSQSDVQKDAVETVPESVEPSVEESSISNENIDSKASTEVENSDTTSEGISDASFTEDPDKNIK